MPCQDAMITDVVTARPEQTVADALTLFDKHNIRNIPIVDEQRQILGLYGFRQLMVNLLPVSVMMDPAAKRYKNMDISLDNLKGMAPWVVNRLGIFLPKKLKDVMSKDFCSVKEETPLREAINLITQYGSPVPVVKDDGVTLIGIVTSQSILKNLLQLASDSAQGKAEQE